MNRIATSLAVILLCTLSAMRLSAQTNLRTISSDTTIKVNNIEFKMVLVKGGEFVQGARKNVGKVSKNGENPSHKVFLNSYYIGQTEVTQGLWKAVMGSEVTLWGGWGKHGRGNEYPVYHVKWTDVQQFIAKLNALTGLQFRLPTEAEWEFAARSRCEGRYASYAGGRSLDKVAWYQRNGEGKTHPVAQKQPNALGLYDMSGNVWEWCSDWYANYNLEAQVNPQGPAAGETKVVRGGSYSSAPRYCSVLARDANVPGHMFDCLGFRLALSAPEEPIGAMAPRKFKTMTFRGGQYHVQGMDFDPQSQCLFISTTTAIVKMALDGTVLGSVIGFKGHVGQVVVDTVTRKLYATLEGMDDDLGNGMARYMGYDLFTRETAAMYIVEMDMDKITRQNMSEQEITKKHLIKEAIADYRAEVTVNGKKYSQRYGCCGIDALAIGPAIGQPSGRERYLYVAYGIALDTTRMDNDYNVILCYPLGEFKQHVHKYFVHTGHTSYGVQDMVWDSFRQRLYLMVYPGQKSSYINYSQYSIDISQPSFLAPLEGVPYATEPVEQLKVASASFCPYGAQGSCMYDESRFLAAAYKKVDNHRYTTIKLFPKRKNVKRPFRKWER